MWNILIEAHAWSEWYIGAENVKVLEPGQELLKENSKFSWKTMGLNFTSIIREFTPHSRLSWESRKKSIKGYHAWLIIPTDYGCKVVTQESQYGWLTFFEKLFQPKKLYNLHETWLIELKKKAEL